MAEVRNIFKINPNRVFEMLPATDVRSADVKQNKNISFVGSYWDVNKNFQDIVLRKINENRENRFILKNIISFLKLNPSSTEKDIKQKFNFDLGGEALSLRSFIAVISRMMSGNSRLQTLSEISSIDGFYLYGDNNWIETLSFSSDLALSYNNKRIFSIKDTQDLYNSSKIGFNTSHFQTKSGFSWRVRDIMATNAVLVSDNRSDFKEFFPKIKIPTYDNPFEAKKICQELLKDDIRRKELSLQCQEAINNGHRFEHRLKDMEDILGMSFLNKNNQKGSYELLDPKSFSTHLYQHNDKIIRRKGVAGIGSRLKSSIKRKINNW